MRKVWQSAGGIATAKILRERALKKYYKHPSVCLQCHKVIEVPDGHKVGETKSKCFCNHTCAAIFNNARRRRTHKTYSYECERCHGSYPIQYNFKRRFCNDCLQIIKFERSIASKTKGEFFKSKNTWQLARSKIARMARLIIRKSGIKAKCRICGYRKHVECSHNKRVADFPDTAFISEINNIKNLSYLCPNHHWEHENGLL